MSEIVRLREVPEPVKYNGRERFVGGWSTSGVGHWLIAKKLGTEHTEISKVATTGYGRDSATNRAGVKRNVPALRRWLADRGEFLLVKHGYLRRIEALKVCNFGDEADRRLAEEQLMRLESRGEVTLSEADRWRKMLFLPPPTA